MNRYCPIIKECCKAGVCMAWRKNDCSIFFFLEQLGGSQVLPKRDQGLRDQILRDEQRVQQLLPECLEWARGSKITRATRKDITTFLILKNTDLCEAGVRTLWRQVKGKLRELAEVASQTWRENGSNAGLAWSSGESEALIREFDSGKSISDLALIHKRSIRAIELRLEKLRKIHLPK